MGVYHIHKAFRLLKPNQRYKAGESSPDFALTVLRTAIEVNWMRIGRTWIFRKLRAAWAMRKVSRNQFINWLKHIL
jgi:hypothetical protein